MKFQIFWLALLVGVVCRGQTAADVPVFPPADTNGYWQTNVLLWNAEANATGYYVVLETNGGIWCPVLFTPTNAMTLVLPSTNSYIILCLGATDGTNTVWSYTACNAAIGAVPAPYFSVAWRSAPATLQSSRDLLTWTNIATLSETNLTFSCYGDIHGFFRTVPAQPLHIWKHY